MFPFCSIPAEESSLDVAAGVGHLEPPFSEAKLSLFGDVQPLIHDYGTAAVSLGILLEDFGLPTPGETLLISAAIAAAEGTLDIRWLLLFAWAGAVIGDNIGWLIGYHGGHRLMVRYGSRIGVTQTKLEHVEAAFARWGDYVILFARFVPILRQFNGIVAGTLEMHWARFSWLNAIGAALWVSWWGLLAYWLGRNVLAFIERVGRIEHLLFLLAGIILIGVALRIFWRRHKQP
jgi:membrane protein DedA with SNARE-associated domain